MTNQSSPMLYKIIEIDKHVITLENDIQTIFIPATNILKSDLILPSNNYDKARIALLKKNTDEILDAMVEPMIDRMVPAMKKVIFNELVDDKSDVSILVGMKFTSMLEESGLEITKLDDKNKLKR